LAPQRQPAIALAAPILTGINPASGSTAGGTLISLTGQDFGASPSVFIGGQLATIQAGCSSTSIVVSSPAGQGTNLQVILIASGSSSNALAFSYLPPSISGVSPATGPTQGGIPMTINGSNFGLNPSVSIGPNPAQIITSTHTQITCILPAGQGQNLPVVVLVGGQSSNTASFTYSAPAITSISPSSGPVAGGTPVTINGSNFGTSPVVTFDGQVVPNTADAITPHGRLYITSPAGFGAAKKITITAGGQPSNSFGFDYDPPTITSISPTSGPPSGNVPITISGQNFAPGSTVTLGGNPVSISSVTVSQIVFSLPSSFSGGSNLQVVVNSENQPSGAALFSYDPPPVISDITPATGPTEGGVTITLNGSGFGVVPLVTMDGTPVSVLSATGSQLTFTLPPGQGTQRRIQVIASDRVSNAVQFDYAAPVITSVSPSSGPPAGGTVLTLTGSNFGTCTCRHLGRQRDCQHPGFDHPASKDHDHHATRIWHGQKDHRPRRQPVVEQYQL
jgi:large repetitive protein